MLFDKIIFGPIQSRRLGLSLGVNLLSPTAKLCNFDCIYCECGWNKSSPGGEFNNSNEVVEVLETKLLEMKNQGKVPDTITFAGNGEPTMHPQFADIINKTIDLRNSLAPLCKISVLTNATMINRPEVKQALLKIDQNILKLDSAIETTYEILNKPKNIRTIKQQIELLKQFSGQGIIQTMLLKGTNEQGVAIDNTTQSEISALIEALKQIKPTRVMLYSLDRVPPTSSLIQIPHDKLIDIAKTISNATGIEVLTT